MKITLRQEQPGDYAKVCALIEAAFKKEPFSDHTEHLLVERLRNSEAFVPQLSIVARYKEEIVGHILLTKIKIINGNTFFESLALAPVSVKSRFQRKGIGRQLILEGHKMVKLLGFRSVVVLGHTSYYSTFGYQPASKYGIILPFNVPDENCMILPLTESGLDGVTGKAAYPEEFFQ